MKTLKNITFAFLATTALIGTNYANAQASDTSTDTTAPTSKKAARTRNHHLESAVRHALSHTKNLDSAGITVVARGGVVTLDGTVPANDQVQTAADAAGGVSGVSSVTNNLIMREAGH
jgi:hyperosmotically inducible periplasmic protein